LCCDIDNIRTELRKKIKLNDNHRDEIEILIKEKECIELDKFNITNEMENNLSKFKDYKMETDGIVSDLLDDLDTSIKETIVLEKKLSLSLNTSLSQTCKNIQLLRELSILKEENERQTKLFEQQQDNQREQQIKFDTTRKQYQATNAVQYRTILQYQKMYENARQKYIDLQEKMTSSELLSEDDNQNNKNEQDPADNKILSELVEKAKREKALGNNVYYIFENDKITVTDYLPKGYCSRTVDLTDESDGKNKCIYFRMINLTNLFGNHGFIYRATQDTLTKLSERTINQFKKTYTKTPKKLFSD
jgi:hypothetical protein